MRINNLLTKLLLFVCSLLIAIVLVEVTIRLIFPFYDPSGILRYKYYADDDIALCIKNFTGRQWIRSGDYNVPIEINKYGFRDKKDILNSTEQDIFVVGDSFTFGHGVKEDKRCSNLLESKLNLSVYNISTPGNLSHYQKLLNYVQGKGAKIKNLIIGVCMENDLADYESLNENRYEINMNKAPGMFANIKEYLKLNSAIYNAITTIAHRTPIFNKIAIRLGVAIHTYGIINDTYSDKILVSSAKKLAEISKSFNTTLLIIPSRALWVGKSQKKESDMHNKFISLLKELNVNVIDLRPYFEQGNNPMQYYFKNDAHWNEKGHLLAAEVIAASGAKLK